MKNTRLLTTLAVVSTMAFVSCEKYENIDPRDNYNGTPVKYYWQPDISPTVNNAKIEELRDNGEYLCFISGESKSYFYYDEEGHIYKQRIMKSYETAAAAKEAFSKVYGYAKEATDANGNKFELNGHYIVTTVPESLIIFNTKELVYRFQGPLLFIYPETPFS